MSVELYKSPMIRNLYIRAHLHLISIMSKLFVCGATFTLQSSSSNNDGFVFHRFLLGRGLLAFPFAAVDEEHDPCGYVDDGGDDGEREGIAEVMGGASRVPRSQVILFVPDGLDEDFSADKHGTR